MSEHYDFFISHHRRCAESVNKLASILEKLQATCFTAPVDTGGTLPVKLPCFKVFLAWLSEDYFHSRSGQTHLASAYMAEKGHDENSTPFSSKERLLLINAEPDTKHIYPVHLRHLLFSYAPGLPYAPEYNELAEWLHEHSKAFADYVEIMPFSGWIEAFDRVLTAPSYFEGRHREIWDIHAALHPKKEYTCGTDIKNTIIISGDPGQGKSCLASEYAFRFSTAYPGGIFRLTAHEAKPTFSVAELHEHPVLKRELLGLLRHYKQNRDSAYDVTQERFETFDTLTLRDHFGELLLRAGQAFLWIVDNLPDGLNGPALEQWFAPEKAGQYGHTLVTTRSHRYESRAHTLHLFPLDRVSAYQLLSRYVPTSSDHEREASNKLLDMVGRQTRAVAMAGTLVAVHRRGRRGPYAALVRRLESGSQESADQAVQFSEELIPGYEAVLVALAQEAVNKLEEPARTILRLSKLLGNHPLPMDFTFHCFFSSGICLDEEKESSFSIYLAVPSEGPVTLEKARLYTDAGLATLERFMVGERLAQSIRVYNIAARVIPPHPRKDIALVQSALSILCTIAERGIAEKNWYPLAHVLPHARLIVGDLRQRSVKITDDPIEVTRLVRLALYLADMDREWGLPKRAMEGYQNIMAYLLKAININSSDLLRKRDFARVLERIGDMLTVQEDYLEALEYFRKSLGIRTYLMKQAPATAERERGLLRHYRKIGDILSQQGDIEGAIHNYRAAHGILEALLEKDRENKALRFDFAIHCERLAVLYSCQGDATIALRALQPALLIYEKLTKEQPEHVPFARALISAYNTMGDLLRIRSDLSGALIKHRMALDIATQLAQKAPDHFDIQQDLVTCHNHLGQLLMSLEDPTGAIEHDLCCLEIIKKLHEQNIGSGIDPHHLALIYIRLGRATEKVHNPTGAIPYYEKARLLLEKRAAIAPRNAILRKDLVWVRKRIDTLTDCANSPTENL